MFKKSLHFAMLTAVTLLLWAVAAFAQLSTGKVEGTVRNKETGQPLPGVQVQIVDTRLGNVTNADGYYFILNVPPGRRSIVFTLLGFQKTTIANQLILAGQTTTINSDLSSTVVELLGITVEGQAEVLVPRDQTVSKQRLTAEKLRETPATRLQDMLVLEAGVQVGGDGAMSREVRIRGGRLGEEAMVVDGITVRNYTANPFRSGLGWVWEQEEASLAESSAPLEFSTGAVEEVDVLTGGFQAEYGNAQSGIINIVTKEGTANWKGNSRFTTDQVNPRTSDWGYNQLQTNIGGPIPGLSNLYINLNGEIQGVADRLPTHADEGFRGINQEFVDRLNHAVRNDIVLGNMLPVFSLDEFKKGAEFYSSKTGKSAALFEPGNPVRVPGNWADRTLASGKLTFYPRKGLSFLSTYNFSRAQNSYPVRDNGNYFATGIASEKDLPNRTWRTSDGDWQKDGIWYCYIPQSYGRRTRTSNLMLGTNWDFYQKAERNGSLQFRWSRVRVQDITSSSLKDNYVRSENTTFMGWSMHDIPFEAETFPFEEVQFIRKVKDQTISYKKMVQNFPLQGTENARLYYPDGQQPWHRNFFMESPFEANNENDLYWLSYFYEREWQNNYKADVDFQLNRRNRAKLGLQYTDFNNNMYQMHNMSTRRDIGNEFQYNPNMMALYIQNRTDLGDFVFDYGIRFDTFNPVDNWGFRNGDQWGERYYVKKISEWSPRFDVGFPVTDKTQLRFSYGVFTQLPSMSFIFSGENPGGLEFSRTDAYEAGLTYLLSTDLVMDMVAYYRDVIGNVASKDFFRDYVQYKTGRRVREYQTGYTNQDNGNIKGLDFTLRKRFSKNFSYNVMYTLGFSRTTGSRYNTTGYWNLFIDPSTGEEYRPPDEIRPIEGDVTHKMSANINYLFPEDFKSGTMANKILKNVRAYAVFALQSGAPAYQRLVYGGLSTYHLNAAEDMSWLSFRDGRPIGGVNYFRGRWNYNLDLRLSKSFNIRGSKRIDFFGEVFNALNNKLPTPYPSGQTYQGYFRGPMGGVDTKWDDSFDVVKKAWFQCDFNGDGVLSLMEAAKGNIAQSFMFGTMDKSAYGIARQVRLGAEFIF